MTSTSSNRSQQSIISGAYLPSLEKQNTPRAGRMKYVWGLFMSELGQTEKNSVRAYVFRFALEPGHCSMQSACLKRADTVAKVFLG
jgi:hypothetical protein